MKFLYYLCCIGTPQLDIKLKILEHNLLYLQKIFKIYDIIINCYNSCSLILKFIKKFKFINKIFIHNKKGILTEVWLTNPYNIEVNNYDYMIFILDDVKLINVDMLKMIKIKEKYKINILSTKVLNSTWDFMNKYNNCITFNNALEIYFLILKPEDFKKLSKINTIKNKWTWGVDHLFGFYKIKAAVNMNYVVEHYLKRNMSKKDTLIAEKLKINYLKKRGFTWPIKNFKPIKHIKYNYNIFNIIIILFILYKINGKNN